MKINIKKIKYTERYKNNKGILNTRYLRDELCIGSFPGETASSTGILFSKAYCTEWVERYSVLPCFTYYPLLFSTFALVLCSHLTKSQKIPSTWYSAPSPTHTKLCNKSCRHTEICPNKPPPKWHRKLETPPDIVGKIIRSTATCII